MKSTRFGLSILAVAVAFGVTACGAKKKQVTELQRKEAEHLAAEAQFAMNMRDWARAETLLTKVVQTVPNEGVYWTSLGSMRVRLGSRAGAKQAYEEALKAYAEEAANDKTKLDVDPWLAQIQVLALLGRTADARAMLDKVSKRFPESRPVRAFVENKSLDKMLADPLFKQMAL